MEGLIWVLKALGVGKASDGCEWVGIGLEGVLELIKMV